MELNDREITLFYNPASKKSRNTLAMAKTMSEHINEWDVTQNPPTERQLKEIMQMLDATVDDMIEKDSDLYREKYEKASFSEEEWLKILKQNPELIQTPIVFKGGKGKFIATPSNVLDLDPSGGTNDFKT
ncbi:ArsC/Spx/MgsR family protein [Roseivirga sp. BDSF3-8]|uniref:ArsC/Spx/MgsR family protein n=1 Tax=Roseivirga sp. BDSF3-8 TaxID=3241598 RepID=UPI003531D466